MSNRKIKSVLISGADGNMGERYYSICHSLGLKVYGADKNVPMWKQATLAEKCDGVIIATPTILHLEHITYFSLANVPILCEKPLTIIKDKFDLKYFKYFLEESEQTNLRMVNQYAYLNIPSDIKDSHYDYFKTGGDGVVWDCINVIGLSNRYITLRNRSPVWDCVINGKELNIRDMDRAYIRMLDDWTTNPTDNRDYIWKAHSKTYATHQMHMDEMKNEKKNTNRHTG